MAVKKVSDGVGKKIVEALKKQSEIEINPVSSSSEQEDLDVLSDEFSQDYAEDASSPELLFEEDILSDSASENDLEDLSSDNDEYQYQETSFQQSEMPFATYQQPVQNIQESLMSELDNFEIPNNIAVLRKLISQLPSGVSRHTGAQIIKQTMEALGISMKSVLQEAQQVQENLNSSAKECHNTIQEYKKQIKVLEKQAQNHQRQYAALNELISLFIQTGV